LLHHIASHFHHTSPRQVAVAQEAAVDMKW